MEQYRKLKEQLLARNPKLHGIEVKPLTDVYPRHKFKEMAEFIHRSWEYTYGPCCHLDYNDDYLRWAFNENDLATGLAIALDGEVKGLIICTHRDILHLGDSHRSIIATMKSIDPSFTRNGLGTLIEVELFMRVGVNFDSLMAWFHSSDNLRIKTLSFNKIFKDPSKTEMFWGRFPFKGHVLDAARVEGVNRLGWYEKMILPLVSGLGPCGTKTGMEKICEGNLEEACSFINTRTREWGSGRLFTPDELRRYAIFRGEESSFASLGVVYRKGGSISAVLVGYNIDTVEKRRDNVFFLDYACLRKDVDINSCIRPFEAMVRDTFNPMAITTIDARLGVRQKYMPLKDVVSLYVMPFKKTIRKGASGNSGHAVVDMK